MDDPGISYASSLTWFREAYACGIAPCFAKATRRQVSEGAQRSAFSVANTAKDEARSY